MLSFSSCRPKAELGESDLFRFIREESHGLMKTKEQEGFRLAMVWNPNEFIARQQITKGTRREFDSLKEHFSKYLYFSLEMTKDGKDLETSFAADPGSFADKISFLSSEFSQNIHLITKRDTTCALECIYTRSYGIGLSQCLVVFEKPNTKWFEIEVKGYPLGFGKQVFEFNQTDITNAPRLKTKYL